MFEVKKWNSVALWSWDIEVDVCAICRNNIMDPCIECQTNPKDNPEECTVAWGVCNVCSKQHKHGNKPIPCEHSCTANSTRSTTTASTSGSRHAKCAPWVCDSLPPHTATAIRCISFTSNITDNQQWEYQRFGR